MGSLTLPSSGVVYVDTQVLIYSVETYPRYWSLLQPLWKATQAGQVTVVSSELAIMETLVGPLKKGDAAIEVAYEQLFRSGEVRLSPMTQPILRAAARLRAGIPALRTPDAIHAATAQLSGCALFLTNDRGFRRVPGLPVDRPDEVLAR